jgi:DNA polymerase (family X)
MRRAAGARGLDAMPVHNADIAAAFEEIAELLELGDENPFRIRAYRNAARIVGGLSLDLAGSLAAGKELPKLPGIGEDLAGKIHEIADTGTCKLLERLRKKFPAGITELMRLPGLGPKRVRALFDRRITSLEALERAARSGKLAEIPGFGEKTAQRLADAAAAHAKKKVRFKLAVAAQYAEPFAKHLGATVAGSYRRMKETVGDLDFLVASPATVSERSSASSSYEEVKQVLAKGARKRERRARVRSAVRPARGGARDLRCCAALLHRLEGAQHRDSW